MTRKRKKKKVDKIFAFIYFTRKLGTIIWLIVAFLFLQGDYLLLSIVAFLCAIATDLWADLYRISNKIEKKLERE